ncbi:hypothetical protein [Halostreptopolyspora alba]|uniref:DUF3558 domain-containing protein n=1 Tax=Halostreptopolyspora alba TaxID=2487137 RepID=A0A3N0E3R8_9ACTN|nr:hypothetical protein EFW17_19235 [Nocardiopsaceae bacterium YIM 96095]
MPRPPRRRPRLRVAVVSASVTLAVYLVAAGVVGAVAYTSEPEEPDGDVALPEDPCTTVTATQLRRLSAEDPSSSMQAAYDGESEGFISASCGWYAEFSDGTLGSLYLSFDVPDDPAEAKDRYESRAVDYEITTGSESEYGGHREITVEDSRELDLGNESFVVFAEEESVPPDENEEPTRQAVARVEVRHANANISVRASESVEADNDRNPDLTGDEDTLVAMAEDALASLA